MTDTIPRVKTLKEPMYRHDRVRLTVLIYRKPGMSTEEFQKYWRTEHSQTFAKLAVVKRNLLKYEQVSFPFAFRQMRRGGFSANASFSPCCKGT